MRQILLITAASIVVFVMFLFPVTDNDIWWHLAYGKLMLEDGRFPRQDVFSYTAYGNPVFLDSWVFDALSFGAFKYLGGIETLNFLKTIISFLTFAAILLYLRAKKLLNIFSLAFVVLALFSIRYGFSLRPQIFSYLFFILSFILLSEFKKSKKNKYILYIFLTQFAWVNFHISFLYGIGLAGIFISADLWREKKICRGHLMLAAAVIGASMLNIFYWHTYILGSLARSLVATQSVVTEFQSPSLERFLSPIGLVILLGLIPVVYFSWKEKKWELLLIALSATAMTLKSGRFATYLILFLCLAAPLYFKNIRFGYKAKIFPPGPVFATAYLLFLFAVFIGAKNYGPGINLGVPKSSYPIEAADFIKQNKELAEKSEGRIFNSYNFGGYLIWALHPDYKIFLDGRYTPYVGEIFNDYWKSVEGGETWQRIKERYVIKLALMPLPYTDGKTIYNNSSAMFPENEWAPIYYDDISVIYARRTSELQDIIAKYGYKIIDPQAMDLGYLQEKIKNTEGINQALLETRKGIEINPESYKLHFTLAFLYNLAGNTQGMTTELKKVIQINPSFEPARQLLGLPPT